MTAQTPVTTAAPQIAAAVTPNPDALIPRALAALAELEAAEQHAMSIVQAAKEVRGGPTAEQYAALDRASFARQSGQRKLDELRREEARALATVREQGRAWVDLCPTLAQVEAYVAMAQEQAQAIKAAHPLHAQQLLDALGGVLGVVSRHRRIGQALNEASAELARLTGIPAALVGQEIAR